MIKQEISQWDKEPSGTLFILFIINSAKIDNIFINRIYKVFNILSFKNKCILF